MKIEPDKYDSLLEAFHKERFYNGNEYLCIERNQLVLDKYDIHFVATDLEAIEYCREMTTDFDQYNFLSLRSLIKTMQEAMHDKHLIIREDGWINLASMVHNRTERLLARNTISASKNYNIMNEKNYAFLKNQIKLTGFGENHADNLKVQIEKQQPDFVLTHKAMFGKDEVVATLHFRKSQETDMYFFNKYNVLLQKEGDDNVMKQMIYLRSKDDNISFKEAYNLMSQRSVFKEKVTKEGDKYLTWVKLDFKETDKAGNFKLKSQSFGYDINKALEQYPIMEIQDPDVKKSIIDSLQRGNRQEVTFEADAKQRKMFIEANPASGVNHALKVYDSDMQRVHAVRKGEEQGQTQGSRQERKNKVKTGEDDTGERKPTRRKSRGIA